MRSPTLVRYRRELKTLRELKKSIDRSAEKYSSNDLLGLLPDRDRTDAMIALYFDSIDQTHGIIHKPSFHLDYEDFWTDTRHGKPAVLVTILLMVACVECLQQNDFPLYLAVSPVPRERAVQAVRACESWLDQQSQKHTTLAFFQIHCLLFLAKGINVIKAKRRWVDSGNLLRIAVTAGLNRDASLLSSPPSAFDREMRRRIWSFVVEADLQSSLDRGMPAVSTDYPSDYGAPSNLKDEDFDEGTVTLPAPRPQSEITKMTYMSLSGKSRALRSELTKLLNQQRAALKFDKVLAYSQEIERSLKELPPWSSIDSTEATPNSYLNQGIALLRIQLEQFLLIIHAFAARTATTDVEAGYSKSVFQSTSRSIIRKLTELAMSGRRFLLLYRQDIVRIFISIGYLGTPSPASKPDSKVLDDVVDSDRSWLDIADQALGLFEDKIMRCGNMQWTFSFAIYDLLSRKAAAPVSSAPKETVSGTDRVHRLCKYVLENQDPGFAMRAATHEEKRVSSSFTFPIAYHCTLVETANG